MSVGPLTDRIVTLNLPMVTAVNYARGKFYMEYGLSDMLQTVEVRPVLNFRDNLSLSSGQPLHKQDRGGAPV